MGGETHEVPRISSMDWNVYRAAAQSLVDLLLEAGLEPSKLWPFTIVKDPGLTRRMVDFIHTQSDAYPRIRIAEAAEIMGNNYFGFADAEQLFNTPIGQEVCDGPNGLVPFSRSTLSRFKDTHVLIYLPGGTAKALLGKETLNLGIIPINNDLREMSVIWDDHEEGQWHLVARNPGLEHLTYGEQRGQILAPCTVASARTSLCTFAALWTGNESERRKLYMWRCQASHSRTGQNLLVYLENNNSCTHLHMLVDTLRNCDKARVPIHTEITPGI